MLIIYLGPSAVFRILSTSSSSSRNASCDRQGPSVAGPCTGHLRREGIPASLFFSTPEAVRLSEDLASERRKNELRGEARGLIALVLDRVHFGDVHPEEALA